MFEFSFIHINFHIITLNVTGAVLYFEWVGTIFVQSHTLNVSGTVFYCLML